MPRSLETYEFSPCAERTIKEFYPKSRRKDKFQYEQRRLQIELIKCHFSEMDDKTRIRANKTLRFLNDLDEYFK